MRYFTLIGNFRYAFEWLAATSLSKKSDLNDVIAVAEGDIVQRYFRPAHRAQRKCVDRPRLGNA